MAKRRVLRGKKLLVAAGLAGASLFGCEDETVANLVAPPDSGSMDAAGPVANLVVPADSSFDRVDSGFDAGDEDAGETVEDAGETAEDAGEPSDAMVIGFPDAPVANLLPPPDGF